MSSRPHTRLYKRLNEDSVSGESIGRAEGTKKLKKGSAQPPAKRVAKPRTGAAKPAARKRKAQDMASKLGQSLLLTQEDEMDIESEPIQVRATTEEVTEMDIESEISQVRATTEEVIDVDIIESKLKQVCKSWIVSSPYKMNAKAWDEARRTGLLDDLSNKMVRTIQLEDIGTVKIDALTELVVAQQSEVKNDQKEEAENEEKEQVMKESRVESGISVSKSDMDIEDWSSVKQVDSSDDSSDDENWVNVRRKKFNISLLTETAHAGESSLEAVRDKDVVICVGNTGAGKSLFINAVGAGKQVSVSTIEQHHETFDVDGDRILGTNIGHSKQSETKQISHYYDERSGLTFVDTAGFADTTGCEYDTATALMIKRVAEVCKTLRFVVLIHAMNLVSDRADSFRKITALIHKLIGDNYNDYKDSFQFIFTHINGVTHISFSEDKYAAIHKEIRDLRKDPDLKDEVKVVVKSISQSLKKEERHHANYFLPLHSNAEELHANISRLIPCENPQQVIKCAISAETTHHILEAVNAVVNQTKVMLDDKKDDLGDLSRDFSNIMYLSSKLQHFRINEAAQALSTLVFKKAQETQDETQSSINQYIGGGLRVEAVVNCVKRCAALERITDSKNNAYQMLHERLKELREYLCLALEDESASFEIIASKLQLLNLWLEVKDLPFQVIDFYDRIDLVVLAAAENAFNRTKLADPDDWRSLIKALVRMVDLQKSGLLNPPDISPAIECKLRNLAVCVTSTMNSALQALHTAVVDDDFSTSTSDKISEFSSLHHSIAAIGSVALSSTLDRCLEELKELVSIGSEVRLNVLRSFLEQGGDMVSSVFISLKEFLDGTVSIHNQSNSTLVAASNLVSSTAQDAAHSLNVLREQLPTVGLADPKQHQKHLQALEACVSVEFVFPQAETNHFDTLQKYKYIYSDHFSALVLKLCKGLAVVLEDDLDDIATFQVDYEELIKTREICPIYENEFLTVARGMFQKWCQERRVSLLQQQFLDCCEDKSWRIGISKVMVLCQALMRIENLDDPDSPCIQSFMEEVYECLENMRESFRSIVDCRGEFEKKGRLLAAAEACSEDAPSLTACIYQSDLKDIVINQISGSADLIQNDIQGSISNAEEIETKIVKLEEAGQFVDQFICNRVSENVNRLRALLHGKIAAVDERLQHLIDEKDWENIGRYLGPLQKSKEKIKQEEYNKTCVRCLDMVRQEISAIRTSFDTPGFANETNRRLQVLKSTDSAFRDALQTQKFNLKAELASLDMKLCSVMRQRIGKLETELNNYVYNKVIELEKTLDDIETLLPCTNNLQSIAKKAVALRTRIGSQFDDVLSTADDFVKSLDSVQEPSRGGYKRSSASEKLSRQLKGLKQSINEDGEGCDSKIRNCYQTVTAKLSQAINDLRDEGLTGLVDAGFFICCTDILNQLKQNLTGIKDHLEIFDVVMELRRVSDLHLHSRRAFSHLSESSIIKWKSRLDELKSNNKKWFRSFFNYGDADYVAVIDDILIAVRAHVGEIRGDVECGNFRSYTLLNKIDLLKMCEKNLSNHIRKIPCIVQESQNFVENRFTESVLALKQLLEDGKVDQIREAFDTYFELACVFIDDEGSRKIVHESLLSFIQKSIEQRNALLSDCSFENTSAIIVKLRQIGFVMMSSFALYNCDLKLRKKDNSNEFKELKAIVHEVFQDTTYTEIGVHYARLGLHPGATQNDVTRAYKIRIKTTHPDKSHDPTKKKLMTELSQRINESKDLLTNRDKREKFKNLHYQFKFLDTICSLPDDLKKKMRELLEGGAYEQVKLIYSRCVSDLHHVSSLVKPPLNVKQVSNSLSHIIKEHINSLRNAVTTHWNSRDYVKLQRAFYALRQLEALFISESAIYTKSWKGIREEIEDEIEKLAKELTTFLTKHGGNKAFENLSDFALKLIRIGRILDGLPDFKGIVRLKMSQILDKCRDRSWGFAFLFKLGLLLEQGEQIEKEGDDTIGQAIVAEFKHFNEVRTFSWNDETVKKPPDQSIKELKTEKFKAPNKPPTPCNSKHKFLLQQYKLYEDNYQSFFDEYISNETDRTKLILKVQDRARAVQPSSIEAWDESVIDALPFLLAGVFAYFTILISGDSFNRLLSETNSRSDHSKVLMKPHPVQVLTILNILTRSGLPHHLMEVRTGEGKSMILGATSAVLAILGFDVRVTCYSEYLSERDNALFSDCFKDFGVRQFIHYSKITKLREHQIAKRVDIRERTLDLFRGQLEPTHHIQSSSAALIPSSNNVSPAVGNRNQALTSSSNAVPTIAAVGNRNQQGIPPTNTVFTTVGNRNQQVIPSSNNVSTGHNQQVIPPSNNSSRKTILLVDEVDVLFGQSYYGQTYNQVAQLQDQAVSALLRRIWMERDSKLNFRGVQQWPEYVALISKYSEWRIIIDTEVKAMCSDVLHYNEPPYVFNEKTSKIGYSSHDSIDYEMVYGYRTAFAYLAESESRGDAILNNVLYLRVLTSQFSYANINPFRILGVSGTLNALSNREKDAILKMGVDIYSYIPSVYGSSKFSFDRSGRGIALEKTLESYFLTLGQLIKEKIDEGRAVVVFFESYERLQKFQSSAYGRQIKNKNVLSSSISTEHKNYVIKRAMHVGQVTLATSIFGRGTDFFCKDQKLEQNGGSFIIQTFLSLEKSEEVQIQGRTARQGKKGGYGMILLIPDLVDSFELEPDSLTNIAHADIYDHLDALRQKKYALHLDTMEENLTLANQRDAVSQKYLNVLAQGKVSEAVQCLHDVYAQIPSHGVDSAVDCHFLIDVSGSMSNRVSGGKSQLRVAKDGINHIISNVLDANRGDTFSLMSFSNAHSDLYHMQPVEDKTSLMNVVNSLRADGGTYLFTAFIKKLKQVLSTIEEGSQQFLFVFTDGAAHDDDLFGQLKALIDQIPETGFKCILAGVGLQLGHYRDQLEALAASGKMELIFFESTDQISDAFDVAAEAIVELTSGYIS